MNSKLNTIGIAGAALVVVGCFLPWVNAMGLSFSGVSAGGQGWAVVIGGIAIGAFYFMNKKWSNATGLILSILIVLNVVRVFMTFKSQMGEAGVDLDVSLGIGIWVLLAGGVIGAVGGLKAMRGGGSTEAQPQTAS